jgi:hypothetical protein
VADFWVGEPGVAAVADVAEAYRRFDSRAATKVVLLP